jgi:hypothetical protein
MSEARARASWRSRGKRGIASGIALVAAATLGLSLVGCAPDRTPMPVPTNTPTASASPKPVVDDTPRFLPGGTALANHAYFDYVNEQLFAKNARPGGKAIIDNLVAAGFDKSMMQVTPDKTAVLGLEADSIEFSVRAFDDCLIGQISGHGYHSVVGPVLAEGVCLAGKTRPINW